MKRDYGKFSSLLRAFVATGRGLAWTGACSGHQAASKRRTPCVVFVTRPWSFGREPRFSNCLLGRDQVVKVLGPVEGIHKGIAFVVVRSSVELLCARKHPWNS